MSLTTSAIEAVQELEQEARAGGRDAISAALVEIRDVRAELDVVYKGLERELLPLADEKSFVVDGVGEFEVHTNTKRRAFQTDDLVRAVLDTRRFDPEGTLIDESPLEKVRHVWNLGVPRKTALTARGLDIDEFCETTFDGFSVQLPSRKS